MVGVTIDIDSAREWARVSFLPCGARGSLARRHPAFFRRRACAISIVIVVSTCLGLGSEQEKAKEKITREEKAVELLRTKGAMLEFVDARVVPKLTDFYWTAHLGPGISDEDLAYLRFIKRLKYVTIGSNAVTDEGLTQIPDIASIKLLRLTNLPMVTDRGIDKLANAATLEEISIRDLKVTDEAFRRFNQLRRLERLDLADLPLSDQLLEGLSALPSLKELDLSGTRISDAGIKELTKLSTLVKLGISRTGITNESLKVLSSMKNLASLGVARTRIDDEGLKYIPHFAKLKFFSPAMTNISDEGLKHLRKARLESLSLTFDKNDMITDKGLRYLEEMRTLKQLSLFGTKATAEGIRNLQMALLGLDVITRKSVAEVPKKK